MALIGSAAFCWGAAATLGKAVFNGYFARHGSSVPIDPAVLAQTRTTFSFLILAPVLVLLDPRRHFSASPRQIFYALLVGAIGLAGSNYFYYYAIATTTVGVAIVIQYLAPVWVLLYMLLRRKQRATSARIFGVLLAVIGIMLAIGLLGAAPARIRVLGYLAAVAAGLCFAFYNVLSSHLVERLSPVTTMIYAVLGASILWAFIDPPWTLAHTPFTAAQWLFLIGFAILSMLLPFLLYLMGLRRLDPTSAIVTSCLEPVFAILLAAAFVGEHVSWQQILGISLVLSATVLIQIPERTAAAL